VNWLTGDMFASHEVVLDMSFEAARGRLARVTRGAWLNASSELAYADGLEVLTRVGPGLGAAKLVRVRILDPVPRGDTSVQALRWEATGAMGRLFPVLDADLVLSPVDDEHCRLALLGAYRPPLGAVGATLDRMLMHHAAVATVRSLLTRVAGELNAPAEPPGTAQAAGSSVADSTVPDLP
jgi:hypothetical protein